LTHTAGEHGRDLLRGGEKRGLGERRDGSLEHRTESASTSGEAHCQRKIMKERGER